MATRAKPRFGLRGLLFNPAEQRFVSRYLNAALNIRRNHLGLRRSCADGRLEYSIVKRLFVVRPAYPEFRSTFMIFAAFLMLPKDPEAANSVVA
jgi:hypothetical protein